MVVEEDAFSSDSERDESKVGWQLEYFETSIYCAPEDGMGRDGRVTTKVQLLACPSLVQHILYFRASSLRLLHKLQAVSCIHCELHFKWSPNGHGLSLSLYTSSIQDHCLSIQDHMTEMCLGSVVNQLLKKRNAGDWRENL